ncbi:MAG: hypothetical protein HZA01_14770 [Nitrospinae bacterium]|nr:hypothetical protein [Nitrospinota bacterium]
MRTFLAAIGVIALILFSISKDVSAVEPVPTPAHQGFNREISDREIIEGFAYIRGDIKELKMEIKRLDDGQKALREQTADLKDFTSKQISDLKDFMLWGFGVLFAGMFTLIGFVLWDRRTALAPAIKKNRELEEREERVEKALKEYAYKEPRLAEILRGAGIM